MNQQLEILPARDRPTADEERFLKPGGWWHRDGDRIICDLCPRACAMKEGDRGFCFVRQNLNNEMMLTTFGRSTGFCIDPIEKKPLNHFYPGTSVLSFGTAGCNLGCKFCQNWDISKSREVEKLSELAMPDDIARAAKSLGCHSVAYTYNDPVVWAEYAIETAKSCREAGVKNVAVTAGYITPEARGPFYEFIDAANVDLKAFTEEFYYKITLSHLEPILETLIWLKRETDIWFEITNLIIPDANDDPGELRKMCDWVLENVGDDVPVHFSAFHPDFRMRDRGNTPHETLITARDIALNTGIKHVYVGNVNDLARQSTYCSNCKQLVIERDWYQLGRYGLKGNRCVHCEHEMPGRFLARPGAWGRKRQRVDMRQFNGSLSGNNMTQQGQQADNTADAIAQALQFLNQKPSAPAPKAVPTQTAAANKEARPMATATAAPPTSIELTSDQESLIRKAAADYIGAATLDRRATPPDLSSSANAPVSGVFTSLKRKGRLRSCCGSFGQTMPLQKCLAEAAHRTATNDPRFPRISPSEVPHLDMEVWLLFAPEKINERGEDRINAVQVGTHGLQLIKGQNRGLLLPGVPVDAGWDTEQFLQQVCIKAGVPPTSWKDDDTTIFRFAGKAIRGGLVDGDGKFPLAPPLYVDSDMRALEQYCRDTIAAVIRGSTPMYYCPNVSDSNVNGAAVVVTPPGSSRDINLSRLNLKQQMPLQSTLFSLCSDLAATLRRRGMMSGKFDLEISIMYDSAMHGTVAEPDLNGLESRCVLVIEHNKTGWLFDRSLSSEQLVEEAAELTQVADPNFSALYSMAIQSSGNRLAGSSVPKAVRGESERSPGVAGKFYPGTDAEINAELDRMLAGDAPVEPCKAAMVPHAGWRFSGQLAADVLKRIKFPKSVICIGPKHTPNGVEWSVAPHHVWKLPGGNVDSDYALAKQLSDSIPGLQMDAAAHQQEHGIEVELPIIHRLSPETKVVGLALGGGNLDRCEQAADALAEVIKEMDEPPLLLISSDMNHYANDEETRRLDALALKELDRLDPDALFNVCSSNHISMCGMIPAVIVLKTLKKLNRLHQSRTVGYATSADVTGDTNRVVGYAGRIFQ